MSTQGIKSPDGYSNGRTPMTPFQPPLPPLPIQADIPLLPSPSTPPESGGDDFTSSHQTQILIEQIKPLSAKIVVCVPSGGEKTLAEDVSTNLRDILSGGNVQVLVFEMKRDGQHWLAYSAEGVKFYVFVGLPPVRSRTFVRQNSSAQEEEFFYPLADGGHRVSQVVFIDPPATTPSHRSYLPKHLKGFLRLDGKLDPYELATRVLGHFAAAQPAPFAIDNAYWSKAPKLINVAKDRTSLGITLVTREMSPKSAFPRIALIKALNEDCVVDLRRRVGRYTHIQSINGCFLDGFSIKNISAIFQSETKRDSVQLMVRFIHSRNELKPHPSSTPNVPSQLDPTREDLPIPLFILSDNHKVASDLYRWLTTDIGPRPSSGSLQIPTAGTQVSGLSGGSDVSDPKFQQRDGRGASASDDVMTPLESSLKRGTKPNKVWFPVDSDSSMRRASIASNFTRADHSPTTPVRPDFKRMLSINSQNIASRRYIPQTFCNGFERRFAHIFLRLSGLYLVTAWFKDLADDPLIQFENISYWLRLIQQHTGCADEKRVVIVGMYNGQDKEDIPQIQRYVRILNEALQESELNKQLFNQNKRVLGMSGNQHSYVFMFDVSRYIDCCYDLHERIEQCMDLFAEKAFYFYPECFERVFKAFDGLNVALRELSSLTKIVASPEDLKTLCKQKPDYALGTIQSYSTALINSSIADGLLKPHFLIELMTRLGTTLTDDHSALYQVFNIPNRALKPLPVVPQPWPNYIMDLIARSMSDIPPISEHDKDVVIQWAELLGLMFKIDGDNPKRESYYFVPSLATEMMGLTAKYKWDEEKEEFFRSDKATVLYAFLHFPCNHQFFDRLVAVLIQEGFSKRQDLFINRGCMEAILPLCLKDHCHSVEDNRKILTVMTVYHPLQNVIEFRTRINTSMKLSFKEAIKDKLDTAFSSSPFHKLFSFANSVIFHVPSSEYEAKLTESALWRLKNLEVMQAEDDDEKAEAEKKLLRTKELTPKVMEEWGATHPQMKEIPSELFMKWSRILGSNDEYWSLVGAKLHLLSTVDIQYYKNIPNKGGNGEEVLKRWQDSDLTVRELVSVLNEINLNMLAREIEDSMLPGSDV